MAKTGEVKPYGSFDERFRLLATANGTRPGASQMVVAKLVKELENPGKRQHALQNAERWFGVTRAADVQALLDAMPQPRTIAQRGTKGRRRRMLREQDVGSWSGHSVKRQHAAGRERSSAHLRRHAGPIASDDA